MDGKIVVGGASETKFPLTKYINLRLKAGIRGINGGIM